MGLGMMAVISPLNPPARHLDPASRQGDQEAATAFRALRDGSGPWYARGGSVLPYGTVRGQRRDWLIEIWDGPGRLLRDRLGEGIEDSSFWANQLESLSSSFQEIPWTPWIEEQYPSVGRRFYQDLGAFLRVCADHELAISFARE